MQSVEITGAGAQEGRQDELTFQEVLHLLSRRAVLGTKHCHMGDDRLLVQSTTQQKYSFTLITVWLIPGRGIPDKYSGPPWRLPASQEQADLVNSVLEQSMRVQAGTVPDTQSDFQHFILSNASLAVCGLLRHYLVG